MKAPSTPAESLDQRFAPLAAAASGLLALAAAVLAMMGLIRSFTAPDSGSVASTAVILLWVLVLAYCLIGLGASVLLLFRMPGAQQFLVIYWLAVLVAAIVLALAALLWGLSAETVKTVTAGATEKVTALTAALWLVGILLGAAAVALLVLASAANSRQRYASMVIVSIGVVAALVIAVNVISQKRHVHRSMETLGRYGLSDRTKRVLEGVQGKLRLTCVYTSTDKEKRTDELRPRVLELLDDMRIHGKDVDVDNAATDPEKDRVIQRLRGQLGSRADEQVKFLKEFIKQSDGLTKQLQDEAAQWRSHPQDSYLNLWSVPLLIDETLGKQSEKIAQTGRKLEKGFAGSGLPDYADLVREVKDTARPFKEDLEEIAKIVKQLSEVAKSAGDETNRKVALAATAQCSAAAKDMLAAVGQAADPAPKDPAAALKKYIAAARRTAQLAGTASQQLLNVGGKEHAELVGRVPALRFGFAYGGLNVTAPLNEYYVLKSRAVSAEADEVEGILGAATPDYQSKYIRERLRPVAASLSAELGRAQAKAAAALVKLATVDDASQKTLELAEKDQLFEATIKTLTDTLDRAEKLPKLKDSDLSTGITDENIVIVEAGDKAEVVSFDEVWPLKVQRMGPAEPSDTPQRRVFKGDSAIASKILAMTQKPFATVLLTYWAPGPGMPPQMARMVPRSDIPHTGLSTLRKRLEEANFEVKDWNLNEDMPKPDEDDKDAKDRQKVLIVLPPPAAAQQPPFGRPQPMPKFGPEHAQKVIDAVDSGIPAVFLATFFPPRQQSFFTPPTQPPYGFGDYLRNDWGVDVMTDYLVVPAVPDEARPGAYKVDGQRFGYLPLSAFSDHPIGKPLQAQRVLWVNLCPLGRAKDARGEEKDLPNRVTLHPLLTVPGDWKSTWATRRIRQLLDQFQNVEGSYIWPDYAAGDLQVPFDVAVAATRPENKDKKIQPARIVAVGLGAAMMDGYLDRDVAIRDAKGTISLTDPPRANADLVVNSVYWLIGRESYIAAGPVVATMREIPRGMKMLLIVVYCIVVPGIVLGIGGLVLLKRRR